MCVSERDCVLREVGLVPAVMPDLREQVEDARDTAEGHLQSKVQEAAITSWQAAAWILERRFGYQRNVDVRATVSPAREAAAAVIDRDLHARHVQGAASRSEVGTALFAQGRSLKQVSEHLGHSQIGITSKTYLHLYAEATRENADAAERFFGAGAEKVES